MQVFDGRMRGLKPFEGVFSGQILPSLAEAVQTIIEKNLNLIVTSFQDNVVEMFCEDFIALRVKMIKESIRTIATLEIKQSAF
jgi:hypothetical protein